MTKYGNVCGAAMALVLAATSFSASAASEAEETAARFARLPDLLDVSLSPSGNKIAYISPNGDSGEALYVIDLANGAKAVGVLTNDEDGTDISSCDWATETYLVCTIRGVVNDAGILLGFDRVISVDADSGAVKVLSKSANSRSIGTQQDGGNVVALDVPSEERKILMTRRWDEEFSTGTNLANKRDGLGVDFVDIKTGSRKVALTPDGDATRYIADQYGEVRLKTRHPDDTLGMLSSKRLHYFRPKGSKNWERLSEEIIDAQTSQGFYPVAVDSDLNVAYGYSQKDGYGAIFKVSLANPGAPELVLAKEGAEVDHLIRIGRKRRVVGASYATEKRSVAYLDPAIAKIATSLSAALPGKPLIDIVDANADESKLMIVAASDVDPGMVYLLDRKVMKLEPLLPVRSYVEAHDAAPMKPVSFPAADGTAIPGYLTLPKGSTGRNLPAIVMPHGGPSARDEWGFDWLVQFFAARGYAVLQPNFRGSAGYGEEWFGKNGFQAWEIAIGDINDAGRWLVSEGIAAPEKMATVGWSYGGYAALQSQVLDPGLYRAVVAIAPVTDLENLKTYADRYTSGALVEAFVGSGPHVSAGSPARNVERITAPVLLFHGTWDQNVEVGQSRFLEGRMKAAGKKVTLVEFDKLDHSLDDGRARFEMLKKIDSFLTEELAR